jgi:hypothetical protein
MKNIKAFKLFENEESSQQFDYMMLNRLQSDCEYFLNWGGGSERVLHQGNIEGQIAEMKKIWNRLRTKPEWLSMEEISDYENKMKNYDQNHNEVH